MRTLIALAFILSLPLAAAAQTTGEPGGPVSGETTKPGRPLIEGARESAADGAKAVRKSAAEVSEGVKKGAKAVSEGAQKGTKAVKRRVAVAVCNDGKYSYTQTNTCSDHGGIKERLKKPAAK
jgi:hypothetical protein